MSIKTNLEAKDELNWRSASDDAVAGMIDEQEVHDTQQSHESCRKPHPIKNKHM